MSFWSGITDIVDQFTGHAAAQAARESSRELSGAYQRGLDLQEQAYGKGI